MPMHTNTHINCCWAFYWIHSIESTISLPSELRRPATNRFEYDLGLSNHDGDAPKSADLRSQYGEKKKRIVERNRVECWSTHPHTQAYMVYGREASPSCLLTKIRCIQFTGSHRSSDCHPSFCAEGLCHQTLRLMWVLSNQSIFYLQIKQNICCSNARCASGRSGV